MHAHVQPRECSHPWPCPTAVPPCKVERAARHNWLHRYKPAGDILPLQNTFADAVVLWRVETWGGCAEAGKASLAAACMARRRAWPLALCLLVAASLAQGQIFGTAPPTSTISPTLAPTATFPKRAPAGAAPPPSPAAAPASSAASPTAPPPVGLLSSPNRSTSPTLATASNTGRSDQLCSLL